MIRDSHFNLYYLYSSTIYQVKLRHFYPVNSTSKNGG
nr:MAG TPA: hypothetical protein [Caudoviricetes sp.]